MYLMPLNCALKKWLNGKIYIRVLYNREKKLNQKKVTGLEKGVCVVESGDTPASLLRVDARGIYLIYVK